VTGMEETKLRTLLDAMGDKGLVTDFWLGDGCWYMPSPLFIGAATSMRMIL